VVTVNDVYKLDNYPRVASAIQEFKAASAAEDCVCVSTLPGDFLSPCTLTNLDGGVAMLRALNEVGIDYVMYGNHEFDLKTPVLQKRIKEYNGTWINSNVSFPALVGKNGKALPEYEMIKVGDRKIALTAFLLDDMSQFAPIEPMPQIGKPTESILKTWEKIKATEGVPDAFLPMLHVNIKEDRAIGDFIAKQADLAPLTPVMLASHDHEVYIEEAGKSLLVKVGADAENIGVIDLFWDADGKLKRNVHMIAAQDFPLEKKCLEFVNHELDALSKLMDVPITEIPDLGKKLSTARVRFEMEPMVSFLLSECKESMPGVEWVVLQGGNVRGGTPSYTPGPFTYGDIMKEFAFDTQMAIVSLPGSVVAETIKNTRTPEGTKPFFLHCDLGCKFADDEVTVIEVNGAPFDPDKVYKISTYQFLLAGMGNLEPLGSHCKSTGNIPNLEICLGIKNYFIETCMRQAWLQILGYANIHEVVSPSAFEERLTEVFNAIDHNKDGSLDSEEIHAFLDKSGVVSSRLVNFLISSFDLESKGHIEMKDIMAIAH
jgi:2',3'-cyclic-nucleotide 2'-phosphodiesterase (5'-nucleotidase family)